MWYVECDICKNLKSDHKKCTKSLFKPKQSNGICVYHKKDYIVSTREEYEAKISKYSDNNVCGDCRYYNTEDCCYINTPPKEEKACLWY